MNYHLRKEISAVVSKAILITGPSRSGTTMMGTLVHSLREVEYAYEPPFLFYHLPLINELPQDLWCYLYEAYLFEEQHIEAVTGRRLNFNSHDDSHIYRAKERNDIQTRLSRSQRRLETFPMAISKQLAYKLPDALPFAPLLLKYYPNMNVVVMFRSPQDLCASIIRKGWFSDQGLSGPGGFWPSKAKDGLTVPVWVPNEDIDVWYGMSEVDRCFYYYAVMYEQTSCLNDALFVDYASFVKSPRAEFAQVADYIGCDFGEKTEGLLEGIRALEHDPLCDLDEVDSELQRRVATISEQCRALALNRY